MATRENWRCEGRIENQDKENVGVTYEPHLGIEVEVGRSSIWLTLDQAHELQRILLIMEQAQAGVQ